MAYEYSNQDLALITQAKLTPLQVDAVIGQFIDKGVLPVDCSIDFLGRKARGEDVQPFLNKIAETFVLRRSKGMSTLTKDLVNDEARDEAIPQKKNQGNQ